MFKPFKFKSTREIEGKTISAVFSVTPLDETGFFGRRKVQRVRVHVELEGYILARHIENTYHWVPLRCPRHKFVEEDIDIDRFWSLIELDVMACQLS